MDFHSLSPKCQIRSSSRSYFILKASKKHTFISKCKLCASFWLHSLALLCKFARFVISKSDFISNCKFLLAFKQAVRTFKQAVYNLKMRHWHHLAPQCFGRRVRIRKASLLTTISQYKAFWVHFSHNANTHLLEGYRWGNASKGKSCFSKVLNLPFAGLPPQARWMLKLLVTKVLGDRTWIAYV